MSMTEFGENARPHLQRAFASVEKARAWRARREKQHRASTAAAPELMQESPAE
jgi:DNA-binding transcriptional LysR family regulator